MERDFTEDKYNELKQYLPTGDTCIWDFIGDKPSFDGSWLGSFDINDYLVDVETYHNTILDRYNTTSVKLKTIFNDCRTLDDTYGTLMQDYTESVKIYKQNIDKMASTMSNKPANLTTTKINKIFSDLIKANGHVAGSVVDYMNEHGMNSSYETRKAIASAMGIKDYHGTAEQNHLMLEKFKAAEANKGTSSTGNGTPIPAAPTPKPPTPKPPTPPIPKPPTPKPPTPKPPVNPLKDTDNVGYDNSNVDIALDPNVDHSHDKIPVEGDGTSYLPIGVDLPEINYAFATAVNMNPIDIVARTLYFETDGSQKGMTAMADTVLNRQDLGTKSYYCQFTYVPPHDGIKGHYIQVDGTYIDTPNTVWNVCLTPVQYTGLTGVGSTCNTGNTTLPKLDSKKWKKCLAFAELMVNHPDQIKKLPGMRGTIYYRAASKFVDYDPINHTAYWSSSGALQKNAYEYGGNIYYHD